MIPNSAEWAFPTASYSIRTYQTIMRLPVLRSVFDWLTGLGNLVIERQDKRVVITHSPKRSDLYSEEI